MTNEEYTLTDTDDLQFIHSQCLYTIQHENKNYFVVGYLGTDSDDYNWSAQEDSKDGEGNLVLIESPELSKAILETFFNCMEQALSPTVEEIK
jgi:hypothetical protein